MPMLSELTLKPVSIYKQDPKLTAAIDKLFISKHCTPNINSSCGLLLPARKINFSEVQQICKTVENTNSGKIFL